MNSTQDRQVLSVSQLNRKSKQLLETHLPLLWIEGEISNLAKPSSGHWYLSLKDSQAQVRGAMFRGRNQLVKFAPANGQKVLVRARVSIYEGRGDYQLIIEHMQAAGTGDLQMQFDALKHKLQSNGWFESSRKKALPSTPERIGIVTSPSGAAIQDILSVLSRRNPMASIQIFPSLVQGEGAAQQICQAIELANKHQACDVLLISRGGGSIEDLWAFNDETLAYTIANSQIPTVSAVGHEVDFTIADFVADLRAPTPSAAAELLSPDIEQWQLQLEGFSILLAQAAQRLIEKQSSRLAQLSSRLRHPGERLEHQAQTLDQLEQRFVRACQQTLVSKRQRIEQLKLRLTHNTPAQRITTLETHTSALKQRLIKAHKHKLEQQQQRLEKQASLLHGLSPLATLARGFSVARNEHGDIVTENKQVRKGDKIRTQLHQGYLVSRVEEACD